MKKWLVLLMLPAVVSGLLLISDVPGLAQETGLWFFIHGEPEVVLTPSPQTQIYASVVEQELAESVSKLTQENFELQVLDSTIPISSVSYEPVGLAVVFVVDRGGISARGDTRIKDATNLVREMVSKLEVVNAPNDDMMAIVGIAEEGKLEPQENFTYNAVDKNRVLNALNIMDDTSVRGGTPLYEGVDKALTYLTANQQYGDVLVHRRKIVIVFSDGVDNTSEIAKLDDIWPKASQAGISIYTIGMARGTNGSLSANADDTLKRIAYRTGGVYHLHNGATHEQVLTFFDKLITQRYQYRIAFVNYREKGEVYPLDVKVDTHFGVAQATTEFKGLLGIPHLALTSPANGQAFDIPYSIASAAPDSQTVELRVALTFPDDIERFPSEVLYFAGDRHIGTGQSAPDFPFSWPVSEEERPDFETLVRQYTLSAKARDPYLEESYDTASQEPVTIKVSWAPKPPPTPMPSPTPLPAGQQFIENVQENWWVLVIFFLLLAGLVLLFVMFTRARKELIAQGHRPTIRQTMTQVLTTQNRQRLGVLKVVQGKTGARQFMITKNVTVVGRDDDSRCDIALQDEFVSNPHFSIRFENGQFYIIDENSTNKTYLNGEMMPPGQPATLANHSIIRVGNTELQFQAGSVTRRLAE